MSEKQVIIQQLTEMGFTALEAEVYVHLLTGGSQTGYATAKAINKPAANVYKALDSLSAKGAVEYSLSNKKVCSALDWKLLLQRRKRAFEQSIDDLEMSFATLQQPESKDEQVYQIEHVEQVLEQAHKLIDGAQHFLLAEIEPDAMAFFQPALQQAASRGVEVWIKAYQAVEIDGVNIILRQKGQDVYDKTKEVSFQFAADGTGMLMACFTQDLKSVIQAFRSHSALMAMNIYCGLLYEIILTQLKQLIPNKKFDLAQQLLEQTAHLHPMSSENQVFHHYEQQYKGKRK